MVNIARLVLVASEVSETAAHGGGEDAHELPNIVTLLNRYVFGGTSVEAFLHHWENVIFSFLIIAFLVTVAKLATRKPQMIPTGFQNVVEMVVEQLEDFIVGVIGPQGRRFVPFLGTLFLYILFMNFAGLVPGLKASTSNVNQTVSLALVVFFYVQFTAIKENGFIGYIDHLMGQPRNALQWVFVPLMFPIHVL